MSELTEFRVSGSVRRGGGAPITAALAWCSMLVACPSPAPRPTASEPPVVPELAAGRCPISSEAADGGMVYLLINRTGLVRMTDEGMCVAIPPAAEPDPYQWDHDTQMVVAPDGELWLSDWSGVRVVGQGGEVRQVATADQRVFVRLAIRSATDVWAVSSDIEWTVDHFDGSSWRSVRTRADFPGQFDDNKFVDLVVTDDAVWVESWNGLWRGVDGVWQPVDRSERPLDPGESLRRTARSLEHLFVADGQTPPLAGSHIGDLATDRNGRIWVVSDRALAVVDGNGRLVAQWVPGSLPLLTGQIERVAVVGPGPSTLPPAGAVATRTVVGRVTIRGAEPLAGARIELCTTVAEVCPAGSLAGRAVSESDGSFRIEDVPDGEYGLEVRPPDIAECDGVFSMNSGLLLVTAHDCPEQAGICDVGELAQCLPFEMPPPPG